MAATPNHFRPIPERVTWAQSGRHLTASKLVKRCPTAFGLDIDPWNRSLSKLWKETFFTSGRNILQEFCDRRNNLLLTSRNRCSSTEFVLFRLIQTPFRAAFASSDCYRPRFSKEKTVLKATFKTFSSVLFDSYWRLFAWNSDYGCSTSDSLWTVAGLSPNYRRTSVFH